MLIYKKYKCHRCQEDYNKLKNSYRDIDIKRKKALNIKKINTKFGYCRIHNPNILDNVFEYLTSIKIIRKGK